MLEKVFDGFGFFTEKKKTSLANQSVVRYDDNYCDVYGREEFKVFIKNGKIIFLLKLGNILNF